MSPVEAVTQWHRLDDPEPDDCDHDDYDVDILTGRMTCNRCDFRKWLSSEEFSREQKRRADLEDAYARHVEQWERENQ